MKVFPRWMEVIGRPDVMIEELTTVFTTIPKPTAGPWRRSNTIRCRWCPGHNHKIDLLEAAAYVR